MTNADIKAAIKAIEIHHEHGWWIANVPDIGVATQAKTLPELGIEVEHIIAAHFETAAEYGTDPFRCKQPSSRDNVEQLRMEIKQLDRVVQAALMLRSFLIDGPRAMTADRYDDYQEAVDNFRAIVDSYTPAISNEGK